MTRVTCKSGYDPFYPLRGARDYYLDAARHGEEPGVWFGGGLEALGLHEGQGVETATYRTVYCEQVNPLTGEHLGRRHTAVTYEQHLARLMSREPYATAERLLELEAEAHQLTRPLPLYTDVTTSFQKSISVLHASIRANARLAREAKDEAAAAHWDGEERKLTQILKDANARVLAHLQEWGGYTRTGSHARRIHGEEPAGGRKRAWSARRGCRAPAATAIRRTTFITRSASSA